MAKVKILLERPLVVHINKEESVSLDAGLQEVDKEIAEHWYVKVHSQPITDDVLQVDESKKALKAVQGDLKTAKSQLADADKKIAEQAQLIGELQSKLNELKSPDDQPKGGEQPKEPTKEK